MRPGRRRSRMQPWRPASQGRTTWTNHCLKLRSTRSNGIFRRDTTPPLTLQFGSSWCPTCSGVPWVSQRIGECHPYPKREVHPVQLSARDPGDGAACNRPSGGVREGELCWCVQCCAVLTDECLGVGWMLHHERPRRHHQDDDDPLQCHQLRWWGPQIVHGVCWRFGELVGEERYLNQGQACLLGEAWILRSICPGGIPAADSLGVACSLTSGSSSTCGRTWSEESGSPGYWAWDARTEAYQAPEGWQAHHNLDAEGGETYL